MKFIKTVFLLVALMIAGISLVTVAEASGNTLYHSHIKSSAAHVSPILADISELSENLEDTELDYILLPVIFISFIFLAAPAVLKARYNNILYDVAAARTCPTYLRICKLTI